MRFLRAVAALIAAVSLGACSDSKKPAAAPSSSATASSIAAPACARPHPSGQSSEAFDFQGQSRTYQLYVPAPYDGRRNVPVVFDFHGLRPAFGPKNRL